MDSTVLQVDANPTCLNDNNCFDLKRIYNFAVIAAGRSAEYIALSDGMRRIRMDVLSGTVQQGPVLLRYRLSGLCGLNPKLMALRRLIALHKTRQFPVSLFPVEHRIGRIVSALQVYDGLIAGASQRDIAVALYGYHQVRAEWRGVSDFMRSRLRRHIRLAHVLAGGGWRDLLL